jgi:hypothetical protein
MPHTNIVMRNIEIEQAQYQARARTDRRARRAERQSGRGSATPAIIGWLLRR